MLRALRLKTVLATLLALFAFILARPLHFDIVLQRTSDAEPFVPDEGAVRSERSANISHIIGVSRKIQLIVNKIMFLQISPDGNVNGTDNDNDYTVLQRASINNYQIKIQGVVTCNFLCMDRCGILYGSKEFTDDCIFNEMMESHHYNTYSSAKYSNDKRTLYLALNKKGIPRKVQTKAKASLGKLETYTNVLPRPVSPDRVETLAMNIAKARILLGKFLGSGEDGLGTNHLFRHHRYQFCPNVPMTKLDEKNKFRCRKREKRKKKKKCREEEDDDEECVTAAPKKKIQGKCDEDEDEQECLRRLHVVRQKRKSRNGSEADTNAKCSGGKCADDKEKKRKKRLKMEKKKFGSNEKTVKYKCGSDVNCNKKKGVTKGPRKKKGKTESQSGEESVTFSLLWREIVEETKSTDMVDIFASQSSLASVESPTEKPLDNYDEEDQTEKFLDDEEETSAEMGYEWATQSFTLPVPSSTSGSEFASASASVSASSSSSTFDD